MSKWLGAAALAFTAAVARAETAPPPLDAYGKLPSIETIKISPDGKRIAFIVTDGEARTVAVSDLDTQRPIVRGPVGTKKTTAVMWAGSNHVIVVTEQDTFVPGVLGGRKSWLTASDVDVDKRRVDPLISLDPTARGADTLHMNVIAGEPQVREVKGRTVIFTPGYSFPPGGGKAHVALFSHDAASGRSELFNDGAEHTRRWLVGSDGQALAEERVDQDKRLWSLRVRRPGGVFSEVMSATAEYEHPAIVGLGRDARSVLLLTYEKGDGAGLESHLVEFSPGQTSPSAPIFDGAPDRLVFDPVTDALIGVGKLAGDDRRYTFFDPKDQAHWEGAEKAYPGCLVTPVSMSADHKRWIVIVDSPTEGPAYALINFDTRRGSWLGENYKAASAFLSEKRPIAFRAADGLPLSGYLTLPRDRLAKGLPLVVLPHGGPAERDGPGFDWWAQALASRGYAVLQVNFRGSSGLGGAFETAGFGQWGRKMQTDLSDGVRFLAGKGIIDPKRVCIAGASYGGYAALAGATMDPGVYRCAVSVGGISDVRRLARWVDQERGPAAERYALRYLGVDKLGDPRLDEISPLRHVDRVNIPILLIHGKDDTVVDFSQSQIMYDALKRAGKDAQLVALNHEDHWLLTGVGRLQMLQATTDFLLKNNPPG